MPAGLNVLLTGASKGIGLATAQALAQRGARLALVSRDEEELESLCAAVSAAGAGAAAALPADLSRPKDSEALFDRALAALGRVDVVINNAADRGSAHLLEEVGIDEIDRLIALNLRAPMVICRDAARHMAARGDGHIVNILSTACLHPLERYGVYTATKEGLAALTRVLVKELRGRNVRVSTVTPGGTDSRNRFGPETPFMLPEEVAEIVLFVLSRRGRGVIQEIVARPLVERNY